MKRLSLMALLALLGPAHAAPVSTTFTYQGELTNAGVGINGFSDFQFTLWDALLGGAQVGSLVQLDIVAVVDGRFTANLDFGDAFDGDARWIEVSVRNPHDPTDLLPFTTLSPRQPLTAVPFAQQALEGAGWAGSGTDLVLDGYTSVGIGVASPLEELHVNGTIYSESGGFRFPDGTVQTSAAAGGGNTLDQAYDQGGPGAGRSISSDAGAVALQGPNGLSITVDSFNDGLTVNSISSGHIARFQDNGVDYLTIDAQGDVGIGVSNASMALDVRESNASANVMNLERTVASVAAADMLQIEAHVDGADGTQFIECERGLDVKFRVNGDGNVTADGTYSGPADFAEMVHVTSGAFSVEAGDVMVIDPNSERGFAKSDQARSSLVAGVYSTRPGFLGSEHDWDQVAIQRGLVPRPAPGEEALALSPIEIGHQLDEVPLAVVGIVPCKVSAENGPIRAGDLLVTSSLAGHAMRDETAQAGTIVGKALGALSSGTGVIKILVTLQ
ncbi:MAG: hypothetical protein DHS20C21_20730 [Gemmatimonadota bacterium]|nr:MAG: hypothetical protein DHS20C21_20730 [Gemmatimonadota bacterium]